MEKKKKRKQPLKAWPFVKGEPVDSRTPLAVVKFIGSTLALMVAFLILGSMMIWKNVVLRVLFNGGMLAFAYLVYWQAGVNAGTGDVNLGEILHQRQSTGREINEKERQRCYHAAKGFLTGLIGCLPIFVCALILALTAKRVMASAGVLPSWLEALERRDEIGAALASYHLSPAITLTDVLRIMVRSSIMPMVNIAGSESKDALLLLERISPLLVLIPGLCYGVGYLGGVSVRARVHAEIEAGKKKIRRRQKKDRQRRMRREKGPEQLN